LLWSKPMKITDIKLNNDGDLVVFYEEDENGYFTMGGRWMPTTEKVVVPKSQFNKILALIGNNYD